MRLNRFDGVFQNWETRYILLLWLSIVCMIPFDMARFDGHVTTADGEGRKTVTQRIIDSGMVRIINFFGRVYMKGRHWCRAVIHCVPLQCNNDQVFINVSFSPIIFIAALYYNLSFVHYFLRCPYSMAGSRALSIGGPTLWNALPRHLRGMSDLTTFTTTIQDTHVTILYLY